MENEAREKNGAGPEGPAGGRFAFLSKPAFQIPFIAAFAALCFFGKLHRGELRTLDTAMYAQMAKEMYLDGGSLAPRYGGVVVYENVEDNIFNKPPLFFWLVDLSYLVFGINKFGASFPAALAAVVLCVLVYLIGKKLDRGWLGFFAAVMLATTPYFMKQSRTCRMDSLLVCFLALAVLAYILAERNGNWWYLVGGALGLAVMTKQVAALTGIMVIGIDMVVSGRWRELGCGRAWLGAAIMLAVAVPWHVVMLARHGGNFIDGYFYPMKNIIFSEHSAKSWYFYLKGVAKFLPWVLLVPVGFVYAVREFRKERAHRLIIVWALVALGVFLLTRTRRLWYLFPALPPLAIIAALPVARLLRERWRRFAAFVILLVFAGTTVAAIAIPFEVDRSEWKEIRSAKPLLDRLAGGGGGPVYEFVLRIPQRKGAKTTLAAVTLFYTDHPVLQLTPGQLPAVLAEKKEFVVITENRRLDTLLDAARPHGHAEIVYSGDDYSIVHIKK